MGLFLIISLIFVLYWRTMDYYYLIDDIVRRWGYLLEIPETSPPPSFFKVKPPKAKHLFLTFTHAVISSLIYFMWGWKAALLFAVNPLAVSCTAWITGGYYQITTLFMLTSYFFLVTFPGILGALIGSIFFTAALGSTINCIAFPFIFLFLPPINGLALFWPLAFYLKGKRFSIGFNKRNVGKSDKITKQKLILVPKVLAYYIKHVIWPTRLAFFHPYGFEYGKNPEVKKDLETVNKEFYQSLAIILAFCTLGFMFSPLGLFIFMAGILPFTQWKVLGQFVAERYLYLPLTGYCLILANVLSSQYMLPVFLFVVGYYIYRSNKYIPAFKNIETLYENGIDQFPDCISNYVNLAEQKLHVGESYQAYKLLRTGLDLDPKSFLCHANMAAYWLSIRQPERGKHHTSLAIKYSDSQGMAYNIFKKQIQHIEYGMNMEKAAKAEMAKMLEEIREEIKKGEEDKNELESVSS